MDVEITDQRGESRFEARIDGELAGFVTYKRAPGRISFMHTEVDKAFEGHGVASKLVTEVLDGARAAGLEVLPFCPFVKGYIARHPEYLDLVPEDQRAKFGL